MPEAPRTLRELAEMWEKRMEDMHHLPTRREVGRCLGELQAALAAATPPQGTLRELPEWDKRDPSTVSDFEKWWLHESIETDVADKLDEFFTLAQQAFIIGIAKDAWSAALAAATCTCSENLGCPVHFPGQYALAAATPATSPDFETWWKAEGADIANHSMTRHGAMKTAWAAAQRDRQQRQ